ncbi:hypothetical protein [Listeria innocua]|uniref:hypothetical protein n=1 Tax=Listeria innocua TaxID=1642 RepID=UPI001629724E|nr:hypothetical protein [Listeria innocua]MBC1378082.1 hypothetical protein [Listeria innocua]
MKKLFLLASLLLIFCFSLSACSYNQTASKDTSETKEKTKKETNYKVTDQKNFTVNKLNNDGNKGLHLEIVVKNKVSKSQSNVILNKVINEYKTKEDALYINMHYSEGAYPAILNARHASNVEGTKITGLKKNETSTEMNKNFNKDR